VSSLPKAVTWKRTAAEIRTRDLLDRESERSTVTPHSIKTVQKLKPRGRTQSCVSSLAVSLRSGTAYITNGRAAAAAAAAGGGIRQPACTVCLREPVAKQTGRRPGWSPVQRVGVCVCQPRVDRTVAAAARTGRSRRNQYRDEFKVREQCDARRCIVRPSVRPSASCCCCCCSWRRDEAAPVNRPSPTTLLRHSVFPGDTQPPPTPPPRPPPSRCRRSSSSRIRHVTP